jgi:antitoxin component YwqK of YwqJK toxin-antitoxin module
VIEKKFPSGVIESKQWLNNSGIADSVYLFLENGVVYKEYRFLKGELNGKCVERNGKGNLKQVLTYKDGLLQGKFTHYDLGKPDIEGQYLNGKRSGYWKWLEDEDLKREGIYNSEGEKDGIWKYYGFNGKLERIVKYSNGEEVK